MQSETYLFYDLETTGINKSFDQILQFAAIRTNKNLEEIERYNFLVKLRPDVIPSPLATLTHHISIDQANNEGLDEYDAIHKIFKLINEPSTISIGYNNLGFDDEFLRFSFFRNLLPPYEHQFKNNCFRADLYPIVASYYLFANDALIWPKNDKDLVSLKLDNINKSNNLYSEGRAHDAITDVIVTLNLAIKLKKFNGEMWDSLINSFIKSNDQQMLENLNYGLEINERKYTQALIVSGRIGAKNNFIAPTINLGQHLHYKNQWIFLRLDLCLFSDISNGDIAENIRTINKKFGDAPLIFEAKKKYTSSFSDELFDKIKANKAFLTENPEFFESIKNHFLDYKYPDFEGVDIDASLYSSGFASREELRLSQLFHKSQLDKKVDLLSQMQGSLHQRALRIIGRIDSKKLNTNDKKEFENYVSSILGNSSSNIPIDFKGEKCLTAVKALEEIESIIISSSLNDEDIFLLNELDDYLSKGLYD